jgi:hypothetical protein
MRKANFPVQRNSQPLSPTLRRVRWRMGEGDGLTAADLPGAVARAVEGGENPPFDIIERA